MGLSKIYLETYRAGGGGGTGPHPSPPPAMLRAAAAAFQAAGIRGGLRLHHGHRRAEYRVPDRLQLRHG